MSDKKTCKTCSHSKRGWLPCAAPFCDNEKSENFARNTEYVEDCEDWEEKHD